VGGCELVLFRSAQELDAGSLRRDSKIYDSVIEAGNFSATSRTLA